MAANGVFSHEGEWDSDLRREASVLPVLELLERLGTLKSIHRDVATRSELEHYLKTWSQARYADYLALFLTAHGDKGVLQWSRGNETTLDELGDMLGDSAQGCYVYLGSCLTLFDERQARGFVERTGVEALMGYGRSAPARSMASPRAADQQDCHCSRTGVVFKAGGMVSLRRLARGAAFEVVLLSALANHCGRPATLFKRLMARHGDLARLYKFVMVTTKETLRSQDSRG